MNEKRMKMTPLKFSNVKVNALKKPESLTEVRKKRGTKSRELSSFHIKQSIKDCLSKNTKFYFMGHYAYIKKEDHEDARIIASSI